MEVDYKRDSLYGQPLFLHPTLRQPTTYVL